MGAPPSLPVPSLLEVLAVVPDPRRRRGRRYAANSVLAFAVCAMLCGARSLYAIAQWVQERREDDPALLEALGMPPGRGVCVATLHRVFKALDVVAFERAVGQWLQATGVAARDAVAIDGKTLRGIHGDAPPGVHLVAAYTHQAGAVLAQLRSAGKGHELAAARAVVAQAPLQGRLVTGDALLTQRELCAQVVAGGGDYLLPVKENQPALRASLERAFSPLAAQRPRRRRRPDPPALV